MSLRSLLLLELRTHSTHTRTLSTLSTFSTLSLSTLFTLDSLVVEHDVWEPDVGGGHVEAVHAPVLLGVPPELVIKPVLLDPQVGSHHLLAEVLGERETLHLCLEAWRHFRQN